MMNDREQALAAGGDDFDTKPVRFRGCSRRSKRCSRETGHDVTRRVAARRRRQRAQPRRAVAPARAEGLRRHGRRGRRTRRSRWCGRRRFDLRAARRRDAGHERARRPDARLRSSAFVDRAAGHHGHRAIRGRRHRRGVPPRRERLRHQADRLPRRARAHRHAPVAQVRRSRACAKARSATRSRAAAPTTACGTGTSRPTRCTGRRAGRRCSATTSRRSAPTPDEWLRRVHARRRRRG